MKINTSESTCLDHNVPAKFFKEDASTWTHIINISILSGEAIPADMENAKVVPIYKKKGKTEAGNHRPVSIRSVISEDF